MSHEYHDYKGPIAIGGVGGSGTRVVSELLQRMGYYFGGCQNKSLDSLVYTLIFKRLPSLNLSKGDFQTYAELLKKCLCDAKLSQADLSIIDKFANDPAELRQEVKLLKRVQDDISTLVRRPHKGKWGWKEPNTHILVDRFLDYWPDFRFICVYRDGRDMAFSRNQNQLRFWGRHMYPSTPIGSLSFWCAAHRRMWDLKALYPERILFVSLEQLCHDPQRCMRKILSFAKTDVNENLFEELCSIPASPDSIGRWRAEAVEFPPDDIEFVDYFLKETRIGP